MHEADSGQEPWLTFTSNSRMRKKHDLSDFDCGMDVGARWLGLGISGTADLLGFSVMKVSRLYTELCMYRCLPSYKVTMIIAMHL